mmetsp:Transcript_4252/g.9961  ORF Transcript_4252/g.9961 Transcript_4252/m.9961 type:complete len:350 (-) Transcript_4252:15-1064(-)
MASGGWGGCRRLRRSSFLPVIVTTMFLARTRKPPREREWAPLGSDLESPGAYPRPCSVRFEAERAHVRLHLRRCLCGGGKLRSKMRESKLGGKKKSKKKEPLEDVSLYKKQTAARRKQNVARENITRGGSADGPEMRRTPRDYDFDSDNFKLEDIEFENLNSSMEDGGELLDDEGEILPSEIQPTLDTARIMESSTTENEDLLHFHNANEGLSNELPLNFKALNDSFPEFYERLKETESMMEGNDYRLEQNRMEKETERSLANLDMEDDELEGERRKAELEDLMRQLGNFTVHRSNDRMEFRTPGGSQIADRAQNDSTSLQSDSKNAKLLMDPMRGEITSMSSISDAGG